MKPQQTLVLGAGVIGITTAYYLAREGHAVTVIDKADAVAADGSYANAGTLSSVHSSSWANPGAPLNFLKSLLDRNSIFRMRLRSDPAFLIWMVRFLRYCLPGATADTNTTMFNLVVETQALLKDILAEAEIDAHIKQSGLSLHGSEKSLFAAKEQLAGTEKEPYARVLDRDELLSFEPALANSATKYDGALLLEQDYSADCHVFSQALAEYLKTEYGVTFHLSSEVTGFYKVGNQIRGVYLDGDIVESDKTVICLGTGASKLTRQLGYDPCIYPVKGYSISLPIKDHKLTPKHFAVDQTVFVAYSHLGHLFRLATYVEFAGYDRSVDPSAVKFLQDYAAMLAPGAFDLEKVQGHTCLRPMTPHGAPVIQPLPGYENIWINAGHGHKGWGMSCASAKLLVSKMANKR